MIRHLVTVDAIESVIRDTHGTRTWLRRAQTRTRRFVDEGKYVEPPSRIWSEIKPVFMALQQNKCVFCERQFESPEYGTIEFDVEHFRPKSSVAAWPPANGDLSYDFETGTSADGYFWLAYDLMNYAASCKVCNTTLKSNAFPVAGPRGLASDDSAALLAEQPFLCYPISDLDDDPESLVTFQATVAVPAADDGHARRRGQVIIDFFRLNHRDVLHHERALMINLLGNALRDIEAGGDPDDVTLNETIVERLISDGMRHAACSRAFRRVWDDDRDLARRYHRRCRELIAGLIGIDDLVQ